MSRTHVVPVIPMRWVSNGSKHKHTARYHVVTQARRPFARIDIANGVLPRGEVRRVVKTSLQTLLKRKATGEKGPATEPEPGIYTLSRSFSHTSHQSQPQILRLPSPYVPAHVQCKTVSSLGKLHTHCNGVESSSGMARRVILE